MDELRTQRDVVERLARLDFELSSHPPKEPIRFVIFGGTGILLQTNAFRFTHDIDIIALSQIDDQSTLIMDKFNINNRMQGVAFIPDDFQERMRKMPARFKHIEVYLPHPIDLIISKLLSRSDSRDILDVVESGLMKKVDLNKLREEYKENLSYTIGHPVKYPDIDQIIERFQEFQAKQQPKHNGPSL